MQTVQAKVQLPETYRRDIRRAVEILKEAGCTDVFLSVHSLLGRLEMDHRILIWPSGVALEEDSSTFWAGCYWSWSIPSIWLVWTCRMPSRAIWKRKESYSRLAEKVISQIKFEIGQVDQLFESYADLLKRARRETPDLVEATAVASVLHSFYNGLENIFLAIAKGIDAEVPSGAQWHRGLLTKMTESATSRGTGSDCRNGSSVG